KGLYLRTGVAVVSCEREGEWIRVRSSANEELLGKKVIICNGSEVKLLYPGLFADSDLAVAKLQLMQPVPQNNYHLPGSTLRGRSRKEMGGPYPLQTGIGRIDDPGGLPPICRCGPDGGIGVRPGHGHRPFYGGTGQIDYPTSLLCDTKAVVRPLFPMQGYRPLP